MRPSYRYELTRLTAFLLLGLVLGVLSGRYLLSFLIMALIYIAEHSFQLLKLIYLIDKRRRIKSPYPNGLWEEIYRAIAGHQVLSRKRKRGLARFASRFREAASAIPDALVILDKADQVAWANPATRVLLGFSWPQAEGQALTDLVAYPPLKEYIRLGDYEQPFDFTPPHNRAIVLSIRITPFGGKKYQRLLVAREITKIFHLNLIRRNFVANVSHELRTPLTVISGFLENLLESEQAPEAIKHPLELMDRQARRMQSLIDDLLTLSRLEMNEKASDQTPLDIPAMLTHILDEAASLSRGQHRLHSAIDPDLWLLGNEGEIRSAFSNLIFNAIKHTPPGSQIHVRWYLDAHGPFMAVEDNGEGIPVSHLPRLTERFYRVDKARSSRLGGTGLGLAIAKHALARHDGELLIASRQGVGSTFTCRFPSDMALERRQFVASGKGRTAS